MSIEIIRDDHPVRCYGSALVGLRQCDGQNHPRCGSDHRRLNHLPLDDIPASGQTQCAMSRVLTFALGDLVWTSKFAFGSLLVGLQTCHLINANRASVIVQVGRSGIQVRPTNFFDLGLKKLSVLFRCKTPVLSPRAEARQAAKVADARSRNRSHDVPFLHFVRQFASRPVFDRTIASRGFSQAIETSWTICWAENLPGEPPRSASRSISWMARSRTAWGSLSSIANRASNRLLPASSPPADTMSLQPPSELGDLGCAVFGYAEQNDLSSKRDDHGQHSPVRSSLKIGTFSLSKITSSRLPLMALPSVCVGSRKQISNRGRAFLSRQTGMTAQRQLNSTFMALNLPFVALVYGFDHTRPTRKTTDRFPTSCCRVAQTVG